MDQYIPERAVGQEEQGFDLRERLSFVWRHWKFIVAITGLTLIVGTVFLLQITPLYTASSQVLVDRQKENVPSGGALVSDLNPDVALIENQMAIIRSTAFLRRVVKNDDLAASAPQLPEGVSSQNPPASTSILPSFISSFVSYALPLVTSSHATETGVAVTEPSVQVGADLIPAAELHA